MRPTRIRPRLSNAVTTKLSHRRGARLFVFAGLAFAIVLPLLVAGWGWAPAGQWVMTQTQWIRALALLAGVLLAVFVGQYFLFRAVQRMAGPSPSVWPFLSNANAPLTLMLELLGVLFFLREAPFPDPIVSLSRHAVALIFIGGLAWLGISMLYALDEFVERRFPTSVADNLAARQLKTRIEFFRRVGTGVVLLIASATMLLTFPSVQYLGTSLLASAGLTGIIAGIAAQRTIGNVIAGLQIAVSQPLRLDDVVVIEGEWGRIEEIGATHVTVALWDKRTLVVPLSYFMDHSFQNWTRKSAQLLGTVLVYTDYAVPVDEVRAELLRILEASELWDGVTWGLQVTGASPSGLELRALMSARDGPTAWDLRCYVREKLVDFLSRQHPQSLPRTRVLVAPRAPEQSVDFLGGG